MKNNTLNGNEDFEQFLRELGNRLGEAALNFGYESVIYNIVEDALHHCHLPYATFFDAAYKSGQRGEREV